MNIIISFIFNIWGDQASDKHVIKNMRVLKSYKEHESVLAGQMDLFR